MIDECMLGKLRSKQETADGSMNGWNVGGGRSLVSLLITTCFIYDQILENLLHHLVAR